jgi:ATP-dependent RNA helicase DeaD
LKKEDKDTVNEEESVGFGGFGLCDEALKAVYEMGFEEPTPIQKDTIPIVLKGKDLIGQAQTGTGKTAAFGLPMIHKIKHTDKGVRAIVLTPTRELAVQVAEEINKLSYYKGLRTLPVYGGASIERQIKVLGRGVHIVVGTPGRVLDHIKRRTLKLNSVDMVVLDEADEMLDMGFVDDITRILKETPKERQTLLFSATMPTEIVKVSKRYMRSPERVKIKTDTLTATTITQISYEVREREKTEALSRLIDSDNEGKFLVFCHTKKETDEVASDLNLRGYDASAIHGDFSQTQRETALKRFKEGKIDILVATDVAARGLDISDISHVVNYSMPQNPERYVHRIGRTGRAGRGGVAITFVTPREDKQLRQIKSASKAKITRGKLPTKEEVLESRLNSLTEKIQEFIDDKRFDKFIKMAEKLCEHMEPIEAAAALLKFQLEGIGEATTGAEDSLQLDDTGAPPGMARLFMTIGREQGITAVDIVDAIAVKTKIPKHLLKKVSLFDSFTFIEVPRNEAEKVIEFMHRSMISGKKVVVAPARPRAGGPSRPGGGGRPGGGRPGGSRPGRPGGARPSSGKGQRGRGSEANFKIIRKKTKKKS